MKKIAFLLIAGLLSSSVIAQKTPQPSPFCKTEQVVGLTTITLEYSRPGVKERTIFGELVPYGEVWRVGANACTKFSTTDELKFGETSLAAGTYALFAFPGENGEWEIVLNTDTEQWGAGAYDAEKNVLSTKVKAQENSFNESMIVEINNITTNSAVLSIKWDKLRVDVPFTVDTDAIVKKGIDDAIATGENLDVVYYKAASYYYNSLKDETTAMGFLGKSIAIKKSHKSLFLKATILNDQGNKKEAIKLAEEAHAMAVEAESKGWADYILEKIEEWNK